MNVKPIPRPADWPGLGTLMSNCDGSIDQELAGRLQAEPGIGQYAGWDFCGSVWWAAEAERWACEAWVYHSPVATLTARTLPELMEAVSARFGRR